MPDPAHLPSLSPLAIPDGQLAYCACLPLAQPREHILAQLLAQTAWRNDRIVLFGKSHPQPRLSAWYGDADAVYRYSGLRLAPLAWTPLLLQLKNEVEAATGCSFNSVLLNYYRDQHDCMGMHSDDERELGPQPAIASLSFGHPRMFTLKHKVRGAAAPIKIALGDGSLLLMSGDTQKNWRHGIARTRRSCTARVNLTFRLIFPA